MYALSEKGERIRAMFGSIAPRYDLLNRLLSLGIDRRWRRFAVGKIGLTGPGRVLDVATGTGDVALEIASQTPASVSIVGVDEVDLNRHYISWMSPLARALMKSGPGDRVVLLAPRKTERLEILDVRYERIPMEPFREPAGAEAAPKRP